MSPHCAEDIYFSTHLMETSNAVPAALRRRRRKKNVSKPRSSLSNLQDAQLENEIDEYLNRGRAPTRKRQRRSYGGCGDTRPPVSGSAPSNSDNNYDGSETKCSRALPMLLYLREAGLTRRIANRNQTRSWKSLMFHRTVSEISDSKEGGEGMTKRRHSALTRLRVPVHPSSAPNAQWNALQYSTPTSYGTTNNSDGTTTHGGKGNNINGSIPVWRPYTQQSIPFSELKTPYTDAILAVDRWGSYMIGVGSGEFRERSGISEGIRPHLAIKFYGVPSPSRLRAERKSPSCASAQVVSPLLHTVPLLLKKPGSVENRNYPAPSSIVGHNEHASPAAETPIKILMSDSGSLGVAFLHHSPEKAWSYDNGCAFIQSPEDEDILGTIIIFEPPRVGSDGRRPQLTKSFHCSNVRIGGWQSFTIRNALWPTSFVPKAMSGKNSSTAPSSSPFSNHCLQRVLSAYMLFNDEEDGYRITWIRTGGDEGDVLHSSFANPSNAIRPARNDIVRPSEGNVWEEIVSDTDTGHSLVDRTAGSCLEMAHEVYLHVGALLSDILSRRQSSMFKRSPYQNESVTFLPYFFYNLVRVSPDDLRVLLVVVFSNREKQMQATEKVPAVLGVFVEVNLFDQSYDELKWVQQQHPSESEESAMKRWCDILALNWRLKERRLGIFCLDSGKIGPQLEQWFGPLHEDNVDESGDDCNVALWGDFLERRMASRKAAAPKYIAMSSLYPDCDVISNRAIHNQIPVKRIASKNSPIELIYGSEIVFDI